MKGACPCSLAVGEVKTVEVRETGSDGTVPLRETADPFMISAVSGARAVLSLS